MEIEDYEKYRQNGGSYVLPVEVFNDLFDEYKTLKEKLCKIAEYAKKRCDDYLKDDEDCDCKYCDSAFNSCKKVLQLAREDITKYE